MYINSAFSKWTLVLVLVLVLFLSVGCQNPSMSVAQTATAMPMPTQPKIVPTVAHFDPADPDLLKKLDFTDLKQGQYLLVQSYENGIGILYVYSTDGQIAQRIALDANFSVSNDGTQLLIMQPESRLYYSLNLHSQELTPLNIKADCYDADLSPDQQHIVLSCSNDWTSDIYVFDTNSKTLSRVTDCLEEAHSCFKPSWSLDGAWIAYYRNEEKSGVHTLDGVYLLNMACNESACEAQIGPIASDSNPAWSHDNELVTSESGTINFSKVAKNSLIFDRKRETGAENIAAIHLSPDGEYVAFSPIGSSAIYLYSTRSNAVEKLIELDQEVLLIGWIIK